MVFKSYSYGAWKKEIKKLLAKRLHLKDRVRYHQKKVSHHIEQIDKLRNKEIPAVEDKINNYLERANSKQKV